MKRHHLAIFTQMGNGHMFPFAALCAELVARGHRVTFPTNERYLRNVKTAGGEAVEIVDTPINEALQLENEKRAKLPVNDPSRFDATELEWAHFVSKSEAFLAQVVPFYEREQPDLVLYNRYWFPGRIVANRVGAAAVQISPHFAYPGESRLWLEGVSVSPPGIDRYARRIDAFFAKHGVSHCGNLWHLEDLNIHLIPREFQYRQELFDRRVVFAGSTVGQRHSPEISDVSPRKPRILVSGYSGLPETQFADWAYFSVFIDALRGMDCECILSMGDSLSLERLASLPENFQINRLVPHVEILPDVTLFVCHGGMGSTLEALYYGVPVLAVPGTPYTNEVAYRVAELGVGESLPREIFSVESVRDAVYRMCKDADLLEKTQRIQPIFQRSDGATAAADAIEGYLRRL